MALGFFGKLFFGFLAAVVLGGIVGLVIVKVRASRKGTTETQEMDEILPGHGSENVADLNDRFNRARYMDRDGE